MARQKQHSSLIVLTSRLVLVLPEWRQSYVPPPPSTHLVWPEYSVSSRPLDLCPTLRYLGTAPALCLGTWLTVLAAEVRPVTSFLGTWQGVFSCSYSTSHCSYSKSTFIFSCTKFLYSSSSSLEESKVSFVSSPRVGGCMASNSWGSRSHGQW